MTNRDRRYATRRASVFDRRRSRETDASAARFDDGAFVDIHAHADALEAFIRASRRV
jgi:hypothetical protein